MVFLQINPNDLFQDLFAPFEEILVLVVQISLGIIPLVKYILATLFLINGILLIYKVKYFAPNHKLKIKGYNYKPILPEICVAYFYIIVSIGLFIPFWLILLSFIGQITPTLWIMQISSLGNLLGFSEFTPPNSPLWNDLSSFQQILMLGLGGFSIAGWLLIFFGVQGFLMENLKERGYPVISVILGIIFIIFIGISPGITLLLI